MTKIEQELKALMLLGLAGDARAQKCLLQACAARLRQYFARRLPADTSEAEDLVQETLIAIHNRRASFDVEQPFTAWLHAIARYKLADHFRGFYRRRAVSLSEYDDDWLGEEDQGDIGAAADIELLMAELPPKQRSAIRLTKLEGCSVDEAAWRTGQSPSGIKTGVHRGLKAMMARVREMDN